MPAETDRHVELQIGHILFIDIVGYSKLSSNEQRRQLEVLNQIVRDTEQFGTAHAADKLIRLPTGDGMALAFLTSPDAPVRCAAVISRQLKDYPELKVRMGIHSGPVDVVHDVSDRPNITGAGINTAQRVMDCADAGHILLSKRAADDLAQYDEWKPQLHDLGEMEVKHGVCVGVVNFCTDDIGNPAPPDRLIQAKQARRAAEVSASRRKRRRTLVGVFAFLLAVALVAIGTWAWHRRFALASAYQAGIGQVMEKSIAVLPFENLGDDKENAYLADGVQDEILTDLAQVTDLKVISRRSVAQYRDTTATIRQIGQALQVAHVLQGTVRKVAGRIHVTAQLIDTRSEMQTWAEKYDTDIADVVQIQNDISQAIVTQLKTALSPAEKAAIEAKPTLDKEAYDFYLRARSLVYGSYGILGREAQANAAKAVTLLESAIVRDPNFALAYCVLADAHMDLGEDDQARQAIDNALRAAPNSADAHLVRAKYLFAHRDVSGQRDDETNRTAEKELAIAAAALPGRVDVVDLRADHEQEQGKWKEALADREKAAQLDPRDANTLQALIELYIMLRRYDQAERLVDHAIDITPQQTTGPFWRQKCSIALGRGDTKAAMAALDAYPMRTSGARFVNHAAARVFVLQREYQKADEILQTVEETAKANKILPKNWSSSDDLFVRGMTLEKRGRIARFRGDNNKAGEHFAEGRAAFEKWLASDQPHNAWADAHSMMYTAEIDAALGRREDALREGRRAVELYPLKRDALLGADLAALLSVVYLWAGEREAALQQLADAAKLPTFGAAYLPMFNGLSAGDLKLNPIWADLHNDPRFPTIVAEASKPIDLDHTPNDVLSK